ncbi:MAG: hypothetical protein ACRDRR_23140 [Pseudonocardiaceae bacterium]
MLRRRADRLDQRGRDLLSERLDTGDLDGEVIAAWVIAQDLMALYQTRRPLDHSLHRTRIPQLRQLGRLVFPDS